MSALVVQPKRRERRRRRIGRRLAEVLLAGVVALALLYGWLVWRGFPPALCRRIAALLRDGGLEVRFATLRLTPRGALEAHRARVYLAPEAPEPFFEAARLRFRLDLPGALFGRPPVRGVELENALVRIGAGTDTPPVAVEAAVLQVNPTRLRLAQCRAAIRDWRFTLSGQMARAPERTPRRSVADLDALAAALDAARERARPLGELINRELARLEHTVPPVIRVSFDLRADDPGAGRWTIEGSGQGARYVGLPFDRWTLAARLEGSSGTARLDAFVGGETVRVDAEGDWQARTGRIAAEGGLPAAYAWNLPWLPDAAPWRDRLRLRTAAPVRFTWETGPRSWAHIPRRWTARFDVRDAEVLGMRVESVQGELERDDARLRFRNIDGMLGAGPQRGPVAGEGTFELDTRRFEGRVRCAFDPAMLLPFLIPQQALYVGAAVFGGEPPHIDASISGRLGDIRELRLDSTVEARHFIYNGSYVEALSTRATVTNQVLRMDPLRVVRPEGELVGRVEQYFDLGHIAFAVDSGLDPQALGRMIGPFPHRFAQQFRVEGPVHIEAAGVVDYREREHTDVKGTVRGEGFGMRWFVTDRIQFDAEMRGTHVDLTNVAGDIYGGTFRGTAAFDLGEQPGDPPRYRVEGEADNLDFNRLVRDVRHLPDVDYEGRLDVQLELSGAIGPGQGPSARGRGAMTIRDGWLLRIPIFGGLSRYLTRLYPGLGFASQSDFRAAFTVADSRFTTERAELEGTLLTIRGRGAYAFDERLDFVVHVKLLSNNLVAEVLRFLTYPVTKLLEFELTGTLREPHWEPKNLPKEIFLIFE